MRDEGTVGPRASERKSEEAHLLPSEQEYLANNGAEYRDSLNIGEDFDFRMPESILCSTRGWWKANLLCMPLP